MTQGIGGLGNEGNGNGKSRKGAERREHYFPLCTSGPAIDNLTRITVGTTYLTSSSYLRDLGDLRESFFFPITR